MTPSITTSMCSVTTCGAAYTRSRAFACIRWVVSFHLVNADTDTCAEMPVHLHNPKPNPNYNLNHNRHSHRDEGCQFQQCNGVVARGTAKNFESFLMDLQKRLTTATPAGCKSTCHGKLTCDDMMALNGTTCFDLERAGGIFSECSCTGCRCHRT